MRATGKSSRAIVCHGRHSLLGRDSWLLVGTRHTRTVATDRSIDHGYRLEWWHRRVISDSSESCRPCKTRTANLYGSFQFKQNGLVDENFTGFRAEVLDFVLLELDGLSWTVSPHYEGTFRDSN